MKVTKASGTTNIIGFIFFLAGLIMLIIGVVLFVSDKKFEATSETTTAVITDIETYRTRRNGESRTEHNVFVTYEVDGKTYDRELGYYSTGMYEGKEIEIMYAPGDPGNIHFPSIFPYLILGIMGVVFGAIGGGLFFSGINKSLKRKNLIKTGEVLTGTITNVVTVTNVRINGRHPYKVECEVVDQITGEKYLYSSESIMNDMSCFIGSSIDVYVDPNDKSKYYMDILSLAENASYEEKIHDYR